jgi:pyrroline-5-carboxylate reductase
MSDDKDFRLAVIGTGNMGGAMLSGLLASGFDAGNVTAIDPSPPPAMADMLARHGIAAVSAAPQGARFDVALFAVKPQIMDKVLEANRSIAAGGAVILSVAAGKTVAGIEKALGRECAVVRTMPNTPALIGRGITAAYANSRVGAVQRAQVERVLKAAGSLEWVGEESLIDAVTAVSGSGPAYVFHLVECMAKAGEREGLPPALAMRLARETVAGAGELMMRASDSAEQLRRNVTSPNGTTAAALDVLMGGGAMEELLARAIAAARKRAQELSA